MSTHTFINGLCRPIEHVPGAALDDISLVYDRIWDIARDTTEELLKSFTEWIMAIHILKIVIMSIKRIWSTLPVPDDDQIVSYVSLFQNHLEMKYVPYKRLDRTIDNIPSEVYHICVRNYVSIIKIMDRVEDMNDHNNNMKLTNEHRRMIFEEIGSTARAILIRGGIEHPMPFSDEEKVLNVDLWNVVNKIWELRASAELQAYMGTHSNGWNVIVSCDNVIITDARITCPSIIPQYEDGSARAHGLRAAAIDGPKFAKKWAISKKYGIEIITYTVPVLTR